MTGFASLATIGANADRWDRIIGQYTRLSKDDPERAALRERLVSDEAQGLPVSILHTWATMRGRECSCTPCLADRDGKFAKDLHLAKVAAHRRATGNL